jgi:hypothetical protein
MIDLNLTRDEESEVKSALDKLSFRRRKSVGLASLVARWSQFVSEIERGYHLSVYDYTNDLTVRDFLEEVQEILPPIINAKIAEALAPIDDRFVNATDKVVDSLLPRKAWWWYRIPRRRDADFDSGLSHRNRLVR